MRHHKRIAVVIPALNEAEAIPEVLRAIPAWVDQVVVADNGSTDATAARARQAGATVVYEPQPGYGAACLAGIDEVARADLARAEAAMADGAMADGAGAAVTKTDIIVFLDGDNSDYPEEMARLVDPIAHNEADMVLGSRVTGEREAGSLMPQQRFGNWLATTLIHLIWRQRYTDLGPFRAIDVAKLNALSMADRNYGWTVEMQIRAIEEGLRIQEVPVSYRCRIGTSKVSGTVRGTVLAGYKILYIIGRQALRTATRRKPGSSGPASRSPRCTVH